MEIRTMYPDILKLCFHAKHESFVLTRLMFNTLSCTPRTHYRNGKEVYLKFCSKEIPKRLEVNDRPIRMLDDRVIRDR
ncbi:hypothetical protein J6590_083541 [Homalodisca vitripennis]|nr:hypothetical protein J6590_083541 [Homalodisca vitripennis]